LRIQSPNQTEPCAPPSNAAMCMIGELGVVSDGECPLVTAAHVPNRRPT
jgi:hypothetical protein